MKLLTNYLLKQVSLILTALIVCSSLAYAQSERVATLDKQSQVISVDESIPFGYMYQLDISDYDFSSKAATTEYFKKITTDLVSYKIDHENQEVEVILNVRKKPNWQVKDWNNYLKSINDK